MQARFAAMHGHSKHDDTCEVVEMYHREMQIGGKPHYRVPSPANPADVGTRKNDTETQATFEQLCADLGLGHLQVQQVDISSTLWFVLNLLNWD